MLRLLVKLAVALTTVAVAATPAGTTESVHRAHSGSTGSLGAPEA